MEMVPRYNMLKFNLEEDKNLCHRLMNTMYESRSN